MTLSTNVRFTHWRRIIPLLLMAAIVVGGGIQPALAAPLDFSTSFTGFLGAGFAPSPTASQLDSDDWRVQGVSDTPAGSFGGTHTTGDYARGASAGNVVSGGIYGFDVGGGDRVLGWQPSGSDLNPGTITLRINNTTGNTVNTLDVSYEVWYNNNDGRTSIVSLRHSSDDATYTTISALDFTSPVALDTNGWQMVPKTTQITGLNIPNGGVYYIQWRTVDAVGGSGGRDELGIDDVSVAVGVAPDVAPTVSTTVPTDNTVGVPINSNITINFSEAVDVTGSWFTISCDSGARTASVSGGPVSYTLNPDTDFAPFESCTVTVLASQVADQDAPADQMAANYVFDFTTGASLACGDPATLISAVQGTSDGGSMAGSNVTIEAVVTADYEGNTFAGNPIQLNGFFVQEEDGDVDGNAATSEGLFIFEAALPDSVAVGDRVRVAGVVSEFNGMTEITATSITVCASGNPAPTAAVINLPVVAPDVDVFYETMENMRVTYSDVLTVSEYFNIARTGEIVLYEGGRPHQYTHTDNTPTAAEYTAHRDTLLRRRVILDDDDNFENSPINGDGERIYHPLPGGLSIGTQGVNFFRGGDTVSSLTGILHWSFNGVPGSANAWRVRPLPQTPPTFTPVNTRPVAMPSVGGNIRVASYNVLNYFNQPDTTNTCGPLGNADCRGADSAAELVRQTDKLNRALAGINADVFGLMELENDGATYNTIAANLNTYLGNNIYAAVNTGIVGDDAITVAIIYKQTTVQPVGAPAILTNTAFTQPNGGGQRNRPAVAQTFRVISGPDVGAIFTVVVNHLKSKSPGTCTGLDCVTNTGTGEFNDTRNKAAAYLVNTWIPSDPTGQGDPDYLLIGDLNAYKGEDPIDTIKAAGYVDLVELFGGANAYSYLFDGQLGYLDHALASPSMVGQVTGTIDWHINADEIELFDYNDTVFDSTGGAEQSFEREPNANPLYEVNAFRTSDHDPVIIGLDLTPSPYSAEPGGGTKSCTKMQAGFSYKIRGLVNGRSYMFTWETRTTGNVWMIRQKLITFGQPNGTQINFKYILFPVFDIPALIGSDIQQTSWTTAPTSTNTTFTIVDQTTDVQNQTVFTYDCSTGVVNITGQSTGPVTNPLYNP